MVSNLPESQESKKVVIDSVVVSGPKDLEPVVKSEARVFLLYSTREEAVMIMKAARELGLTGEIFSAICALIERGYHATDVRRFPQCLLVTEQTKNRRFKLSICDWIRASAMRSNLII